MWRSSMDEMENERITLRVSRDRKPWDRIGFDEEELSCRERVYVCSGSEMMDDLDK